jgi:hypothetical protein
MFTTCGKVEEEPRHGFTQWRRGSPVGSLRRPDYDTSTDELYDDDTEYIP